MLPHPASHILDCISRNASCLFLTLTLTLSFAYAGEYHAVKEKTKINQEVLVCSQCHTMHGTQGNVSMVYGGVAGGNIKLLRHATILQLCLYCHDGDPLSLNAPDVWGSVLTAGQINPSAGNLCSGGGALPCSSVGTNHTVDSNANVTAPGSSPAITFTAANDGFTCVNCHNPHGTSSYRNLRDNGSSYRGVTFMGAGETITYSMSPTENNTNYVNNLVAAVPGVAKYETSTVLFKSMPATNTAGIQGFCKSCHTLFHGAGADTNMGGPEPTAPWTRHPTKDTNITTGAGNLHADSTCWTTGTALNCAEAFTARVRHIDPDVTSAIGGNEVPFCLTCHRAHGSDKHSNLVFGAATSLGGAGTMMRQTCQQCHNQ